MIVGMLVLSACSHAPAPAPMLSITQSSCDPTPDMRNTVPIAYNEKDNASVLAQFDEKSACLQAGPGEKSLYKVYRLPDAQAPYSISIVSVPTGASTFAPRIAILDSRGILLREIARDTLAFRNGRLSALFRSHADDGYLLLASDADMIGKTSQQIVETTKSEMLGTGTVFVTIHTGDDQSRQFVYSHNGSVEITLSPIPQLR